MLFGIFLFLSFCDINDPTLLKYPPEFTAYFWATLYLLDTCYANATDINDDDDDDDDDKNVEWLAVACLIQVYVFLGDDHALIDLVRYMHYRQLNNGEYVVIAVHDDPYDPLQQRYFNKC